MTNYINGRGGLWQPKQNLIRRIGLANFTVTDLMIIVDKSVQEFDDCT